MPTNRSFSDESYSSSQLRSVQKKINNLPLRNVTGSTSLIADDENMGVEVESATATNITVPNNSAVPFPIGTFIYIIWFGTGQPSIVPGSGVTIHSDGDNNIIPSRYKPVTLYKRGTNEWYLWGIGSTGSTGGGGTPAAPTSGVVDDDADTFDWTNNPLFTTLGDYEYTLNGGSSYSTVTAKPIVVGSVNKAIGQVGVRVKAVGGNPASATLYNASAFTAASDPNLLPGFTHMAFPTVDHLVETSAGSHIWKSNVAVLAFNGFGKENKKGPISDGTSATDFFIGFKFDGTLGARVGIKTDNLADDNYDMYLYGETTGELKIMDYPTITTSVMMSSGTWYLICRESGVFKVKSTTDFASFTTLYTFVNNIAALNSMQLPIGVSAAGDATLPSPYGMTYPQYKGLV